MRGERRRLYTRAHAQDFIITAVLAVLWLFAAIAWAFSAGSLAGETSSDKLKDKVAADTFGYLNRCVHR